MKPLNMILAGLCASATLACTQPAQQTTENKENAVIENIMSRRSIRQYKDGPVARETMDTILKCGINAPNAINRQAWEVRVVDNPTIMEEIIGHMIAANPDADPAAVRGCFRGAPTMVFIANDTTFAYSPVDCGLMAENMMLSAWSLGVGSVCLGSPVRFLQKSPEALAKLNLSEGYELLVCIGMGYPNETPAAKPRDFGKVQFIE